MQRFFLILVASSLIGSSIHAATYRTMDKPDVPDDLLAERPLSTADIPGRESLIVLPPGTVLDSSYYDWQRNGSLNRRVWVNSDGSVHATYMKSPDQGFVERGMIYYYANSSGGPFISFGGVGSFRNGFGNLSAYPTSAPFGAVAVLTTHNFGTVASFAFIDAFQGVGAFAPFSTDSTAQVVWPKPSVNSDGSITLISTLNNQLTVNGIALNVAYERADDSNSGFSQTWTWLGQDPAEWEGPDMQWPAVASGEGGKVGIVVPDFATDIHFFESTDNGVSFAETLITNAAEDTIDLPTGPTSYATIFLPWINVDIVYVGTEPHIVWTGLQGAQSGGVVLFDYGTRVLHWSPSTGTDTVVVSQYQGAVLSDSTYVDGGSNHASLDWPQIGVSPDGSVLYVVYVAFNPDDVDPSNSLAYGDIWGVFSIDNGETWSDPINISNPDGMYPGSDDRYPSISPVNYEAAIAPGMDAFIVYQSDASAGSFLQGEENANWDYFLFTGVDFGPSVGIGSEGGEVAYLPRSFALHQNCPNPFNPSTTISFDVPGSMELKQSVNLDVYDLRGRRVISLVDGDLGPGVHRVAWNGKDSRGRTVPSGIYLYTLRTARGAYTRKMVVLK